MVIQTIEIQNFRGIENKKKFSFEGKPFVLLVAPNGLGKTTLIDAIEWCLTGNISRLKNAFDTRSTNDDERKKNVDGILKNKKANKEADILVILNILDNEKEYLIKRVQKKDELNAKLSSVWMNDSKAKAVELLPQIVDQNFYNFHFCDVQKSIEIQKRKRKDFPDLFSEFITDYTRESTVAENLDLFAEDTQRYKQDLQERKIIAETTINTIQRELKEYEDTPVIKNYPEIQIYEDEEILISEFDDSMLKKQLEMLYKSGYKQAHMLLIDILSDVSLRSISKDITEMANILKVNKEIIDQTIKQGLHIGTQSITTLESSIKRHKEINLTRDNVWSYSSIIISFNNSILTEDEYNESKVVIQELEKASYAISGEIEILSKGNEVLDSLSSILSKEQGLRKYRDEVKQKDENVKCPVCGSERFGKIEQAEILSDAREYINQHGLLLTEKKKSNDQLENQIELHYESLIRICNQILSDEINKEVKKKDELIKLYESTTNFFTVQKRLEQLDSEKYNLEKLVIPEYVDSVQSEIEGKFLSIEVTSQKREDYKKILDLLEYKGMENEPEKIIVQKIHELANDAPNVINFSHSLLIQKISSINSILNNKKYLELRNGLFELKIQNSELENQQNELDILNKKVSQHAKNIRNILNQLKSDEYNKVGPNLFKFYKKLSRINTINNIQLKQEADLMSMVDESDKNIVNILSNGQLSVFMLAYFFAGIIARNEQEVCKIYFIDDLTACLDDVNMLAFLDLLKYQLLARDRAMDQIFFASCDDRICKLLRYKLNGCGIDFCELREKDFV